MVMYMKVNGKMTKLMAKDFIPTLMGQDMKESGEKISNMVMELKDGQMEHVTKVTM